MSICVPEMIISMLDNLSHSNGHWHYISYAKLHIVDNNSYSVTHVRNSEIKQLSPLFFAMLGDIDLIFGIWVYNDELQIKFTCRSGPMIFGPGMALGLWNFGKYLVVTTLFHYNLRYWLDFWYESV
jgi:hypothetical protein